MSKSDYLESKILDHVLRNTAFTQPAGLWIALFTADPTDTGSLTNECANAGGYARVAVTFGAASAGSASNSGAVTFAQATADWMAAANLTHFAVMDSQTIGAGNMLYSAALTVPKPVKNGDTPSFAIGALVVTED
jgi:hypothetical protein